MYSVLPSDFDGLPPLSDDPPPLSGTPLSSLTPFRDTVVSAGAGVAPPLPPSETPFCAGRVNWETPSIWLTSECLVEGCLTEAYLKEVAALGPGQSLLIEADVPQAEIQKALMLLKLGTHLMLNYIFVDNDDSDSDEEDENTYNERVSSLEEVVRCIPSGITIHIRPNADTAYVEALSRLLGVGLTFALRGQLHPILRDFLSCGSHNITYSILPEHSLETAESIVHIAAKTGGAICFEEGVSQRTIFFSVTLKERPKIALPIPPVWSMESMIDELTVRRPFTFVPHSSTTVEEMQRLARMCQAGKCELAMDERHTKAQVIAVANSLPDGTSLFLSTDEQDLRLQVAKRMPSGSKLHLSDIKSVKEISDILAASQEIVNVVLPVSVREHVMELERSNGEDSYKITTNSDGSFHIRKEPIGKPPQIYNETLEQLAKRWRLAPDFEYRDFSREEDILSLVKLDFG